MERLLQEILARTDAEEAKEAIQVKPGAQQEARAQAIEAGAAPGKGPRA